MIAQAIMYLSIVKLKCHKDDQRAYRVLAKKTIRLMSKHLKQNICGLAAQHAPIANMDSIKLEEHLNSEVQLSCKFWVQYLTWAGALLANDTEMHHTVYSFLQAHFLHWLEALSLMKAISEGTQAITSLERLIEVCKHGLIPFLTVHQILYPFFRVIH